MAKGILHVFSTYKTSAGRVVRLLGFELYLSDYSYWVLRR